MEMCSSHRLFAMHGTPYATWQCEALLSSPVRDTAIVARLRPTPSVEFSDLILTPCLKSPIDSRNPNLVATRNLDGNPKSGGKGRAKYCFTYCSAQSEGGRDSRDSDNNCNQWTSSQTSGSSSFASSGNVLVGDDPRASEGEQISDSRRSSQQAGDVEEEAGAGKGGRGQDSDQDREWNSPPLNALLRVSASDLSQGTGALHRLRRLRKSTVSSRDGKGGSSRGEGTSADSTSVIGASGGGNIGGGSRRQDWDSAGSMLRAVDPAIYQLEQLLRGLRPQADLADILAEYDGPDGLLTHESASYLVSSLSADDRHWVALKVLETLEARGHHISSAAYTSLISAFARNGPFEKAGSLFRRLLASGCDPSRYAYTAAIQGCSRAGRWRAALDLFREMERTGVKRDVVAYNHVLLACGRAERLKEVLALWKSMNEEGCEANQGTFHLLLSTFVKARRCDLALEVYFSLLSANLPVTLTQYKGLICCASKAGRWPLALDLYRFMQADRIVPRDILVYNAVIGAVAQIGGWEIALAILADLRSVGLEPDCYTWSSVLTAFARNGEYNRAMRFHEEMLARHEPNLHVCNAALLACQGCGKWQVGLQMLWEMERGGVKPDVVSFSTLIKTCEVAGVPAIAMKVYERMQKVKCRPNAFTFGPLITAHGNAGDWRTALHLFEDMRLSGVLPNVFVFNAILKALGDNHQLRRAEEIANQMTRYNVQPDECTLALLQRFEIGDQQASDSSGKGEAGREYYQQQGGEYESEEEREEEDGNA
eukprot:TRINITY_DN10980_c0_g1_i1.p1 TRINITY_DN10980_c0_g1~~TRINITY_DN10980_c0_g1_i1.p1  ORF type:complete len:775 (-),score=112.26 TRINITY_DN10980_c0_g1_i1:81-2384(-)